MRTIKKSVLATIVVGLVFVGMPKVNAGTTDSIAVTVTLDSIISVSVDMASWAIGAKALSTTSISDLVTATNDGNVAEKFMINGANGANGWTLGALIGEDIFALGFDKTEAYDTFVAIDTTGVELAASVAVGGTQTFKMKYSMPSSNTKAVGLAQGFAVTVTASAAI